MPDDHKQFVAWWNTSEQEELRKSCAMGWGKYIWQASRAALRVELPEPVAGSMSLVLLSDVRFALQQAGIEVK